MPNDQYDADHDYTDRTAGAIADEAQIPLATISGWVYHDADNDGIFDHTNEQAIGGVTLELLDANGNGTGITTTTSTDPAKLGFYEFRNLTPGQYGVREVQPTGWLDGKDTAGDHGGTADPETSGRRRQNHRRDARLRRPRPQLQLRRTAAGLDQRSASVVVPIAIRQPTIARACRSTCSTARATSSRPRTTDANGEYIFTNLTPGIYSLREHQPADTTITMRASAAAAARRSTRTT